MDTGAFGAHGEVAARLVMKEYSVERGHASLEKLEDLLERCRARVE